MIFSGRNGQVKWDKTGVGGATATALLSIKGWTLSLATEKINVTCLGDQNRVYVPGLPDISGSLTGFWNSADMSVVQATKLTTPGWLELIPNVNDGTTGPPVVPYSFSGKAYLDAEINTDVEGAPELTSQIVAAGPWTLPTPPA